MPQTQHADTEAGPADAGRTMQSVVETRFDGPHVLGSDEVFDSAVFETPLPPPDQPPPDNVAISRHLLQSPLAPREHDARLLDQLRMQAQQLAGHLRSRQSDLDRREADLHARLAALDNDWRSARLWLGERQHELAEQAEELARREREWEDRRSQISAAEAFHESARKAWEQEQASREAEQRAREQELEAQAARLETLNRAQKKSVLRFSKFRRRSELALRREKQQIEAHRASSLELVRQLMLNVERRRRSVEAEAAEAERRWRAQRRDIEQQMAEIQSLRQGLELRHKHLAAAEALLARDQHELAHAQAALAEERARLDADLIEQRRALAQERAQVETGLAEERRKLQERSEQVDARQAALEQLQTDLRRTHREALETRLATEELWAQLSGAVPAAALTSSLSRLRGRLADHFRLASADLEEQRKQLESMHATLAERHEQLAAQKKELQAWLRRRQQEIEEQAERLVRREQELDSQQDQWEALRQRWHQERREYEQEIRRLLAELRTHDARESTAVSYA